MVNYKNGKIYKIISDKTDKFYVGSTAQLYLSTRMATHKCKHNVCMSKNIGYDLNECSIILIENYPCKDVYELKKREREYYDKYKKECKEVFLNKRKPTYYEGEKKKLKKKWREENKEKIKQKKEVYTTKNKEKINKYSQEYREKNKDRLRKYEKEYREKNKEKIKGNRYNNKEKINKYDKEYREKNKEKINQRVRDKLKEKITCECGITITKGHFYQHKKTKKHIKLIQSLSSAE